MADRQRMLQATLTRLLVGFVLVSIGFAAGKHAARIGMRDGAETPRPAEGAGPGRTDAVVVYYLHATFRCVTCNTIEDMTRSLLASEFSHELEAGTVRLEAVDFQQNEALARRYEVAASCVVVTRQREGRDVGHRRLDEVWTLINDPPAFDRLVGDAVRTYLTDEGAGT